MKTWTNPAVEELEIAETAYGWNRYWFEYDPFYPAGGTGATPPGNGDGDGNDDEQPEEGYAPES
jgi:hypothetical protein